MHFNEYVGDVLRRFENETKNLENLIADKMRDKMDGFEGHGGQDH